MKEKMKYFLELIQTKKSKKIAGLFGIFIIIFYSSVYIYSLIYEQDKLAIDRYNFNQLKQIKPILKTLNMWSIWFRYIWDFNKVYNANLKPIKNCYYISDENWDHPYILGFQLESLFYKFLHFWKNYAYPTYDIPKRILCTWKKAISKNWCDFKFWENFCYNLGSNNVNKNGCSIVGKEIFIDKISKPCDKYEFE